MNTLHNLPILPAKDGFLFGADPELFIMDPKGKFVGAEGLIPGTKSDPYKVDGGAVQVDGMAAEYNIDPAASWEEFNHNNIVVVGALQAMLPKGYTLHAIPSVTFDEDVWEATPDKAKVLGCSPDFNAWEAKVNPAPKDPSNPRLRCAGGHLHIGWRKDGALDFQHLSNCNDLVKQLDWYLGGWAINHDKDTLRRRLYGKAGSCRYKGYGVEYRVLSNFWVLDERTRLVVWNRMQQAIVDMKKNCYPVNVGEDYNRALVGSINESNLGRALTKYFGNPLKSIIGVDTPLEPLSQSDIMAKAIKMKPLKDPFYLDYGELHTLSAGPGQAAAN